MSIKKKTYKRVTTNTLQEMKRNEEKISMLTAYDYTLAKIIDNAGIDVILVGDSVGMVLYGMKSTKQVKIDTMILHAKAVTRTAKKSLVVVDMPYKTYTNKFSAFKNAKRILKATGCDAVKLEGGKNKISIIKYIIKKGIPVMGHIGLLPQYINSKFKIMGKNKFERKKI